MPRACGRNLREPLKIHSIGKLACNEASSQCSRSAATLRLRHFIAAHFARQNEFLEVHYIAISSIFYAVKLEIAIKTKKQLPSDKNLYRNSPLF